MQSRGKPFKEWVDRYTRKTGEPFDIPQGFKLAFDEAKGFFVFGFGTYKGEQWLELKQTCVDEWKWVFSAIEDVVRQNGLAGVLTTIKTNPRAYARLTGGKHIETDKEGRHVIAWRTEDYV
jgi:hypothetical protein